MRSIRCQCGKIVCQVANLPDIPQSGHSQRSEHDPSVVILCRHCKRYVVMQFPAITAIYATANPEKHLEHEMVTS